MEIEAKQQAEAKTKEELNEKLKDNLDTQNLMIVRYMHPCHREIGEQKEIDVKICKTLVLIKQSSVTNCEPKDRKVILCLSRQKMDT